MKVIIVVREKLVLIGNFVWMAGEFCCDEDFFKNETQTWCSRCFGVTGQPNYVRHQTVHLAKIRVVQTYLCVPCRQGGTVV